MTISEFKKIEAEKGFYEAVAKLEENCDCITDYEILKDFAKYSFDNDNLYVAAHVANALADNNFYDGYYWRYDYSMGTLETPTPIETIDDIIDLLDDEGGAENDN